MTELETKLSHVEWCYCDGVWTTVQNGIGFAIHQSNYRMWLVGYPKEVVLYRREIHSMDRNEALYITTYRDPCKESMFNIPASADFISAVVLKHYLEILP